LAIAAGHSFRQLAVKRQAFINVDAFAVGSIQESAFLRRLVGIVHLNQRHVVRIPARYEPVAALLHPAGKVVGGNLVGLAHHRIPGLQDAHRRLFIHYGRAVAGQFVGVGAKVVVEL
jgi:hypothetical protein